MTITKILKQLKELDQNFILYKLLDNWDDDKVREEITIGNVVKEFEEKSGTFYEYFKITSSFRDFMKDYKTNNKKFPIEIKEFYNDTYERVKKDWEDNNPGKNFECHINYIQKKKQQEARARLHQLTSIYLGLGMPYFNLPTNYYNI